MIVVGDQQHLIDLSKTKARTLEAKSNHQDMRQNKHYRQPQSDEPLTTERTQSGKTTNGKDEETENAFLKISHPYKDDLPRAREADTRRSHPNTSIDKVEHVNNGKEAPAAVSWESAGACAFNRGREEDESGVEENEVM
ncbi:hypothetical protein Bca4012_092000 [Brassica carinata]